MIANIATVFTFADGRVPYLSPCALAAAKDGKALFICCDTGNRILRLNVASKQVERTLLLPGSPSGCVLSQDESKLFVTCAKAESDICVINVNAFSIISTIKAGHTATAPVTSKDGRLLFACNRFNNSVGVYDIKQGEQVAQIPVEREPVAAALTKDGRRLLVANMLPSGRADIDQVSAAVSVIEVERQRVEKTIRLPSGGVSLLDVRVAPDGRYAVATHILSRFHLPTYQVERGWMNANAITIIDLKGMEILNTVLLDEPERGAANSWGLDWSSDGTQLIVAHAGTHEVSLINFSALIRKLNRLPITLNKTSVADYGVATRVRSDVPDDLTFLSGIRQRVKLPVTDRGPRFVEVSGTKALVANYFSDTISMIDLVAAQPTVESIGLSSVKTNDIVRQGEFYFHDATICREGWQSCASCHPGDARMDDFNWDLLNDGIGNPKNTKSLLLAHKTPPAMSLGVRETAEMAVRSGIKNILFAELPEEVAVAIDAYLKSLKPVPSPYLVNGKLSQAAQRGKMRLRRIDGQRIG